jgi:hypothetical protein
MSLSVAENRKIAGLTPVLLFVLITLLCVSAVSGRHSQSDSRLDETLTKKWILEQPKSPLKLTLRQNGEVYDIENYSSRQVGSYRLGCIVEEGSKIYIKRKARWRQVEIAPLNEKLGQRYGKSYTLYADADAYPCVERKMKLAVLEVMFSDRSKWRMQP